MVDFFRGWKRKGGGFLLVLACILMAAWVRSWNTTDQISVPLANSRRLFESIKGELHLLTQTSDEIGMMISMNALRWQSSPNTDDDALAMLRMVAEVDVVSKLSQPNANGEHALAQLKDKLNSGVTKMGFWYLSTKTPSPPMQMSCGSIPYWSLVLPLTVFSTWLLLSRPHISAQLDQPPFPI